MDVQRWLIDDAGRLYQIVKEKRLYKGDQGDKNTEVILVTDHEAALASARVEAFADARTDLEQEVDEWLRGRSISLPFARIRDEGFNAALDAAIRAVKRVIEARWVNAAYVTYNPRAEVNAIAALRKPVPQPEPLAEGIRLVEQIPGMTANPFIEHRDDGGPDEPAVNFRSGQGGRWIDRDDALSILRSLAGIAAPQPEPLTREEQNERWRQDYNTQARLRKVDDWRLTEYPKPFEDEHAGVGMNAGGSIYPVPEGRYAKAAREGRERREQQTFSPEAKSEPAAAQPEGSE